MVVYQDATTKPSRLSKLTGVPISTICDWINKIENDFDIFEVHDEGGRKSVISRPKKEDCPKGKEKPYSTRKIVSAERISQSSANRILIGAGLQYRSIIIDHTSLTQEEKDSRVEFCRRMLERPGRLLPNT